MRRIPSSSNPVMIVSVTIFIVTILTAAEDILGLIELPSVQDKDIFATEAAIRDITNRLFSQLQLTPSQTQTNRLKQFSTVHNYLISLTLKDYDNLKEIGKLARVANGSDKADQFIGVINEILNEKPEDRNNINAIEADVDRDVISTVDSFLDNLKFLKQTYREDKGIEELNKELLNHLNFDGAKGFDSNHDLFSNFTFVEEEESEDDGQNFTASDASDYWQPSGRRIYKGERTYIKYFPFMASVEILGKFVCAGSIIKSDLVITAASCLQLAYNNRFYRENPKFLYVRVGSSWYLGGGELIPVLEVYFHPRYDPKTLTDNLAIMRLRRWIKFSKGRKRVKKIRLDPYDHGLPQTTAGIATAGWGAKTVANILKGPWYNQLSYAVLDFYDLEDCKDIYSSTYVKKKNFCAGFYSRGGGACNRDVGGPGIVDGTLTGIISFGSPVCGAADTPTVFTKVGFYRDWIEDIMKQPVPYAYQKTTLYYPTTLVLTPQVFTVTTEATIKPLTSTKSTQYPTFTLTENIPTGKALLTSAEKAILFDKFLNEVVKSAEKDKKTKAEKNSEFLRLKKLANLVKAPLEAQAIESAWQGFNSSAFGYTAGADVNEPLTVATGPTQILSSDEDPPALESMAKSEAVTPVFLQKEELSDAVPDAVPEVVPDAVPGAVPNIVPDSVQLERDNAHIAGEDNQAVLSEESTEEDRRPGPSASSEGLSLPSFEDLTLRQANNTEVKGIFNIPRENLYDIISDRLALPAADNEANNSWTAAAPLPALDRKRASIVDRPPRRNVQRVTQILNMGDNFV